jgi:hypothetical protein
MLPTSASPGRQKQSFFADRLDKRQLAIWIIPVQEAHLMPRDQILAWDDDLLDGTPIFTSK